MRLRKRRDAGVALRAHPPSPGPGEGRPAEPVTPVDEPRPETPPPAPSGRRRLPVVVASVIALLILGGAIAYTYVQARDDGVGEPASQAPVTGDTRSILLVVAGEDGSATSLALFVSDGLEDYRVLVAPRDLTMQIPGYGEGSLGAALVIEDADLVRLALVNELGIRIDDTITIMPGEVASLVGEAIRLDLPNPFIISTPQGNVVSASAGSDVFVPETVETLLVTQGADTPLDWLQRQRAVWEAMALQLSAVPGPAAALNPTFEQIVEPLGEAVVSVLPVDRVGVGISELYVVSRDSELLNERIAYLSLSDTSRPRVEILNATTFPGVTRPLAELLIEEGYQIIKTENAEERFRTDTLIIAQGVPNQQAALDSQRILGAGDVVVQASGSGVVDVSIIVGRDIASR